MRGYQILFMCLLSSAALQADIIYSNFNATPGNLYNPSGAAIGGATSIPGRYDQAFAFVSPANYLLTGLNIPLELVEGTNDAVISLWDNNGGVPGSALTGWVTGPVPLNPQCCGFQSLVANDPVTLLAGQTYWVLAVANGSNTWISWSYNNIGAVGSDALRHSDGAFQVDNNSLMAAFQVLGTPVPEPTTETLVFAGCFLLAGMRGKRWIRQLLESR